MDRNTQRRLHRRTLDDDIFYDRDTREVYRSGSHTEFGTSQDFYSLPAFDSRAPLKVYFDFTYLCNLECRHCITNSSPRADRRKELPSERILSIMDELAAVGVLEIAIGGGEPLCHPDLFSFLGHSRAVGLNVVLTTNGLLVTPEVAERLKECQVSEVRVSFDGSQTVHDSIRGAGTYRKALKAVRVLMQNGVRAVPRLTVCNNDELGLDMLFKDLAATGASAVKAALVEPQGRATLRENQDLFRYPRDTATGEYLLELAQKHALALKLPDDLAGFDPELTDGRDLRLGGCRSCGVGLVTAYISPSGNVQPCSGITDMVFGNVRSNSFMSAWTSHTADTWRQLASTHDSWRLCAGIAGLLH